MAQLRKKRKNDKSILRNEIYSLIIIAVGMLILISLQTQSTGEIGKFIKNLLYGLFSTPAIFLPYIIILWGVISISGNVKYFDNKSKFSIVFIYVGYGMLHSIYYREHLPNQVLSLEGLKTLYNQGVEKLGGGIFGGLASAASIKLFGVNGSYVIIITLVLASFLICTKISLVKALISFKDLLIKYVSAFKNALMAFINIPEENEDTAKKNIKLKESLLDKNLETLNSSDQKLDEKIKIIDFTRESELNIEKSEKQISTKINENKLENKNIIANENIEEMDIHINTAKVMKSSYIPPSLDLLNESIVYHGKKDKKEILNNAKILEDTLANFGVDAKVMQASKGPTITRYEIQPSPGVKVSKIVSLSDDIALNLAATNIRIEAPIPGKAAVGIEIPNENVSTVGMKEVLQSDSFINSESKLSFALGKDIAGNPIITDLSKMPHLLIAGSTGSGKSVCINTLITSILFKSKPEEVKLLLIDPKVVELNNYNGIPHLLIPVVTDPQKASGALNWAVQEMTNRYKHFAENSVRDIGGYNDKMLKEHKDILPQIVIVIDELADLMMVAPGQVEDAICRLAQMARAAGIHLIVATQRPSVDVITGVIKANIPSRIAFAVSSQADSRTILDMGGAEKLLGKGDMLFYPVGASKPKRIQGAFISDSEVERIVSFIKSQSIENNYGNDIEDKLGNDYYSESEEVDDLLSEAIELVVQSGQASVSMLQRRFRIGYNRAARLMDAMAERKIVGDHEGSKPRQVLISKEELLDIKSKS